MVPKKFEQINDFLFIDTYKSNKIKIGVNEITVNDSEMCVSLVNTGDISPEIAYVAPSSTRTSHVIFSRKRYRKPKDQVLFSLLYFVQ